MPKARPTCASLAVLEEPGNATEKRSAEKTKCTEAARDEEDPP
jgi:hypothetical protein